MIIGPSVLPALTPFFTILLCEFVIIRAVALVYMHLKSKSPVFVKA